MMILKSRVRSSAISGETMASNTVSSELSRDEALASLERLKLRNETVALFLVDQRMPQMTGVEFLAQALPLYPNAKRALLTAYADTDAAIRAINHAQVDYYLLKPWHPPEERLYPVIDDLLGDWHASFKAPFQGIRVLGHRWSPHTHQIKEFLAKKSGPLSMAGCRERDGNGVPASVRPRPP